MTVGVLLLAAGRSERFGADKRFALLPDGRTVLETTLLSVRESGLACVVCVAPGDDRAAAMGTMAGAEVVICNSAAGGMGCSLAEGVARLPGWRGVLVALGDMPFVLADTYRRLGGEVSSGTICRPVFQGRCGHPVAFGSHFFGALSHLSGDVGARDLLHLHSRQVHLVETDDAGVVVDIDTPDELSAARECVCDGGKAR